jgi:signal transduction histidine kinase/DNA-binding response OmpR family regulator
MAKVLVIDDNVQLLELYQEVLSDLGYEVLTADRGELGLNYARENQPDCIMLDIMMSDMDGLDALEELNGRDPSIPIIIITGFPSAENAIEALKRGAFDFLTKGCTLEEMIATTQRALERRQLHLENEDLLQRLQDANANLEQQVSDATAQVRELAEFNQSILEGIDAGLLASDNEGNILFGNSAARRSLQLTTDELVGQNITKYGFVLEREEQDTNRAVTPHIAGADLDGKLNSVERKLERSQRRARYRSDDGVDHTFGYSVSVPDHIPGVGAGYVLLFRDLTEMEELRSQMQRLQKLEALNIVIAGVAHEIKNPIAGIKGVASVMSETLEDDDPRKEHVSRILDETRRVTKLIDDFFSFSRPSAPKLELFDITEAVGRVVRLLNDTAKQRKVELITEMPDELPKIRADRDQMQQIVLNLVMNSIDALEREGRIEVTTNVVEYAVLGCPCVRVKVRDSGPGFPEESRHRIFDPFFTTKASGTGLGLHICQNIALRHGGRMEAVNDPDGGASVSLYIPLSGTHPTPSDEAATARD